ncbi:hypothetical protein JQN72_07565 [Phycicoccus sp. CSK15P-2]|uniref:hypothetical protein n=1 Tax=Phycicoccus sp. CSK15P-2 TaxID=2807627 RepID=UPI00194E4726|nr:hypothetical protein [Phycicoccus sp. CSK15P-2]MBM6404099.1 hypothetical protein [Phycicoccus sp. CSK15P-2]
MTWLGVWLVGLGLADLVRGGGERPGAEPLARLVGAVGVVVVALLAGLHGPVDLVVLAAALVPLVLWLRYSQQALMTGTGHLAALASLAVGAGWLVGLSGWSGQPGGVLGRWLAWAELPGAVGDADVGVAVVVVGLLLANLATGNVVVQLVLVAIGAKRPAERARVTLGDEPADQLRGGRLLGPMERVLILGLGLAGQLGAAGLVIAAKGLIRFPELQSKRSERVSVEGVGIDEVTEYFLVGSFVSWLLALGSLVLAG